MKNIVAFLIGSVLTGSLAFADYVDLPPSEGGGERRCEPADWGPPGDCSREIGPSNSHRETIGGSMDEAGIVHDLVKNVVMNILGVNGIGIGTCDPNTGQPKTRGPVVYCVQITTETDQALDRVLAIYPEKTQIDGVFITVEYIGEIGIK